MKHYRLETKWASPREFTYGRIIGSWERPALPVPKKLGFETRPRLELDRNRLTEPPRLQSKWRLEHAMNSRWGTLYMLLCSALTVVGFALFVLNAPAATAQSVPTARPEFEVASIKPHITDDGTPRV